MDQARRAIAQPLRAATYETLIGLLTATGLRVGEALRLDRHDIDWAEGVLLIRQSKFGKSRQVPLAPSTLDARERYARDRDRLCPPPRQRELLRLAARDQSHLRMRLADTRRTSRSAGWGEHIATKPGDAAEGNASVVGCSASAAVLDRPVVHGACSGRRTP